jgi:hypothetical protein
MTIKTFPRKKEQMSKIPYPIEEDESCPHTASEPSFQEMIQKRRFPLSEAMKTSITLEESRKIMEDRIARRFL